MNGRARNAAIGARFGRAAARYEAHAPAQRAARAWPRTSPGLTCRRAAHPGDRLRHRTADARAGAPPGTGRLDAHRHIPGHAGDRAARSRAARQRALRGAGREHPDALPGGYDLICSSLAVQWFGDLNAGLGRLAALLAPGGHLAIATLAEDTFAEWRTAHARAGLDAGTRLSAPGAIRPAMGNLAGAVRAERLVQQHRDGLHFLQDLKGIGATAAAPGHQPLGRRRRVLATFNEQGASVTYHVAYGMWKKTDSRRAGVFVTGTDTGIGKTLVSAILARAWNADYWKPVQTGVAEDPATPTRWPGWRSCRPSACTCLRAAGAAVALGGRAAGRRRAGRHHHRAAGHRRAADRGRRRRPACRSMTGT